VSITGEDSDDGHRDASDKRANNGDEFERAADRTKRQGVGNAHDSQHRRVSDKRQSGESELGANELRQHLIEVVQDILEKLALRARLDQRNHDRIEVVAVTEKEDGDDGHEKEHPQFLGGFGDAHTDALREGVEVLAMRGEKALNADLRGYAPSVLSANAGGELADLARDLTCAGFVHQAGKRFGEPSALAADPRTSEESKQTESDEQEKINSGDGAGARADELLQANDRRINEIGKEDGEEKQDQGAARGV